jgi:hypothetical protein
VDKSPALKQKSPPPRLFLKDDSPPPVDRSSKPGQNTKTKQKKTSQDKKQGVSSKALFRCYFVDKTSEYKVLSEWNMNNMIPT